MGLLGYPVPGVLSCEVRVRDLCPLPLIMHLSQPARRVMATLLSLPSQDAITANCIGEFCVGEWPVIEHTEGGKTLII